MRRNVPRAAALLQPQSRAIVMARASGHRGGWPDPARLHQHHEQHPAMSSNPNALRTELAAAAARLIAEEGCDYGQAKRRALHELLGTHGATRALLPDNAEIEHELRRHLLLFAADTHPALLAALRRTALRLMQELAEFNPHLVGAVLNGTATEHSDIELQLYTDSAKDVEVQLMNAGIDFDASDAHAGDGPAAQERLLFLAPLQRGADAAAAGLPRSVGVCASVYERDAIRVAPRSRAAPAPEFGVHPVAASGRANLAAVQRLIAETAP